eukprot:SAG22_NODE_11854_length_466_cov_1.234332_2_plen_29_part_01
MHRLYWHDLVFFIHSIRGPPARRRRHTMT